MASQLSVLTSRFPKGVPRPGWSQFGKTLYLKGHLAIVYPLMVSLYSEACSHLVLWEAKTRKHRRQ